MCAFTVLTNLTFTTPTSASLLTFSLATVNLPPYKPLISSSCVTAFSSPLCVFYPSTTRSLLQKLCCPDPKSQSNTYCYGYASPPGTRSWIRGYTSCSAEQFLRGSSPASTGLGIPSWHCTHLLVTPSADSHALPSGPQTQIKQKRQANLMSHLHLP